MNYIGLKLATKLRRVISVLMSLWLTVFLIHPTAFAGELLPPNDLTFQGKIGITYKNSQADPSILTPIEAPKDAPNTFYFYRST